MAATTLTFSEENGKYSAEHVSEGLFSIQIKRSNPGRIWVSAYMEGMDPYDLDSFPSTTLNALFAVSVPEGFTVKIVSESEVILAKIM